MCCTHPDSATHSTATYPAARSMNETHTKHNAGRCGNPHWVPAAACIVVLLFPCVKLAMLLHDAHCECSCLTQPHIPVPRESHASYAQCGQWRPRVTGLRRCVHCDLAPVSDVCAVACYGLCCTHPDSATHFTATYPAARSMKHTQSITQADTGIRIVFLLLHALWFCHSHNV